MAVRLCKCGFANKGDAGVCVACGEPLEDEVAEQAADASSAPDAATVWLEGDDEPHGDLPYGWEEHADDAAPASTVNLRNATDLESAPISVPSPGGFLGRGGDFSPDAFTVKVSRLHAKMAFDGIHWNVEHYGLNATSILRAGEWIDVPKGRAVALLDGDQLRMADMMFLVSIDEPAEGERASSDSAGAESECGCDDAEGESPAVEHWVVICPVCGAKYEVEGADDHIDECSTCTDALDKRQIAGASARLEAKSA